MVDDSDLLVLGAGPAGAAVAVAAARHGLRVILLDDQAAPGGQIYRAPPAGMRIAPEAVTPDDLAGDALRERLAAAAAGGRIRIMCGARVWSISGRFRVDAISDGRTMAASAPRLVAATGAHERIVPFPGWTVPGVLGLAAATILIKAQGVLPGRRTLVAGCGPLLAAVAAKVVENGGEVAAVADLSSRADWLRALPALASRPDLLRMGLGWALKIGRSRVPVFFRHTAALVEGDEAVTRVTLAPVDADGAPAGGPNVAIDADALAVGHGLVPGAEVTRLLRARHAFDPEARVFRPLLDAQGRSSVEGLYACGDGVAVNGALPAALAGERAGLAAAFDAGAVDAGTFARDDCRLARDLDDALRFARAMNRLMRPRPRLAQAIAADTIVCRCEDVRRSEIDAAIAAGAREMNQLKHFTRCGMGPCQGRMCGETVAELLAPHVGREAAGVWTGRPPLRPVPLAETLGDFVYDDIPVPAPAPL